LGRDRDLGRDRSRGRGLRREELASLSGVSLTWYTGLEQGRATASGQVLEAVGRVLRLDEVGRRHLRRLSAPEPPPVAPPGEHLRGLAGLLDGWPASPAALLDHRFDIVAANAAWTRVWGDPADHEPARRNALWMMAATSAAGLLTPIARQFRMAADLYSGDPRIAEISALLRAEYPGLGPVWDCRGVGAFGRPTIEVGGEPATAYLLHPTGQTEIAILVAAPLRTVRPGTVPPGRVTRPAP
jgi:transcriptional regulator with XRE-family HTH domain